jgi:transcriptional repressor NrdR
MRCPYCREDNDKVVDSRSGEDGATTRRRRQCLSCGRRFTTYERVEGGPVRVVKKRGERQPFDRNKIRLGIEKACWNLPVSAEQIEEVTSRIERSILESNEREVTSERIGELIMDELRRLHQVAYVRFASVYREFKDVTEFMQVLQEFMRSSAPEAAAEEG